jgi:PAS domain S-box-containing protein
MESGRVVLVVGVEESSTAGLESDDWTVERVGTVAAASDTFDRVDCVVTAADLPDGSGLSLCERIRERRPALPVVFVPATSDDELARDAVRAGVTEYLPVSVLSGPDDLRGAVAAALDADPETTGGSGGADTGAVQASADRTDELERYETIVEAVDDLVFAFDEQGRFTFANEAHESMTGNPAEDLIGKHPAIQVPDADVAKTERIVRELLADDDRDHATFEMDVIRTDGERVPCETHIALMTDEDGEFRGTAGIVRDVSDRKEQEDLFSTLVEEANDGIIITSEGGIQFCNEQMAKMLGATREELTGESVHRFVADEDRETVEEMFWQRYRGESDSARYEIDLCTTDGERVPVEVNTSLVSYQGSTGDLAIVRDITDRREREQELELYEKMLNAVPDLVYAVDEAGRFIAINEAGRELTGWNPDEAIGEHVSIGMNEADVAAGQRYVEQLLADDDREKAIYEMELHRTDGETIPAENHVALLTNDEGHFRGSVGVVRDISDRHRRERRLTVLNRALRHDLRNSMHVVLANAELLTAEIDDPDLRDRLDTIRNRAEEVNGLSEKAREIEQTLGTHQTERRAVDLAPLLDTKVETFRDRYPSATVEATLPDHAWVEATELIDSAVGNLVENSIQHNGADPTVAVSLSVDDDRVRVTVADDGPGIPEKERRIVKQGSETPLDHASGLGLWLVAWITRDSGGTIRFEDHDDWGSVVHLDLDRCDAPSRADAPHATDGRALDDGAGAPGSDEPADGRTDPGTRTDHD